MATTRSSYTADGLTAVFNIDFAYSDPATIFVSVNGVDKPFTLTGPSQVTLSVTPTVGAAVVIYRKTPVVDPKVVFENAQVLTADNLNDQVEQILNSQQEVLDAVDGAVQTAVAAAEVAADDAVEAALPAVLASASAAATASANGALNGKADKSALPVNVKDHGATGLGVVLDGPAIQAALDTGAPLIRLPKGTYRLGDAVLRPASGQRIVGEGAILQKQTTAGAYRLRAFFDIEDKTDIHIEGIDFKHDALRTEHAVILRATTPGQTKRITLRGCVMRQCHVYIERHCSNVRIEGCDFIGDGVALCGIATGGQISKVNGTGSNTNGLIDGLTVRGCYFERTINEGVDINWHTQNVVIDGNRFYNCDTSGTEEVIDVGGDVLTTEANQCRNITITNNEIVNDVAGAVSSTAIQVKGRSTDVVVSGNIIRRENVGGTSAGIVLWNTDDTIVRNNCISGWTYGIISTDNGESLPARCTISSNIVRKYGVDGLELRGVDMVVEGNEVDGTGSSGYGIQLVTASHTLIGGNIVRNAALSSIRAENTSSDLTFRSNRVRDNNAGHGYDILSPRSVLVGNTASESANHGFSLNAERLVVIGNQSYNNGDVTVGGDGFTFGTCNYSVIQGNIAFDSQGVKTQDRGFVFAAADRCIVNGNVSYGNLVDALSGTGSLTASLVGAAGNIAA